MRVIIFAKSTPDAEAAQAAGQGEPGAEDWEPMMRFHEELAAAGVLLASDRLEPSSRGVRLRFDGPQPTVTDGPFTEAKELIAGFWLWQVNSLDEAIEWLKRAPFGGGMELEVRPIADMEPPAGS
jgi:hypothetical protein